MNTIIKASFNPTMLHKHWSMSYYKRSQTHCYLFW